TRPAAITGAVERAGAVDRADARRWAAPAAAAEDKLVAPARDAPEATLAGCLAAAVVGER
ncbi:MAG: hypothetical protein ABSG43_21240, partial [Solirubrobacteraceae bacterium]